MSAKIAVLDREQPSVTGTIVSVAGPIVQFKVPVAVPCGAIVQIETEDALLLGEVCETKSLGAATRVSVAIAHALNALSDLHRLNRSILGEDSNARSRSKWEP